MLILSMLRRIPLVLFRPSQNFVSCYENPVKGYEKFSLGRCGGEGVGCI